MKTYELMLIVNPTISESDRTSSIEEIKKIIENFSWKIKKEDVWWEKKMAYKLNNSDKGFYILFEIEIDWKELKTITKEINLNKNIWRHMFVAND